MTEREWFYEYFQEVKRPGKEELLFWLDEAGFFEKPASTKYHLNCKGGLAIHSRNVFNRMLALADGHDVPEESIIICALLHDVCKVDNYRLAVNGYDWEHNPYALPLGHGEKSVMLIQKHMQLTDEEMLAIRWHMGAWDHAVKGGCYDIDKAYKYSPLVCLLQEADALATHLDK